VKSGAPKRLWVSALNSNPKFSAISLNDAMASATLVDCKLDPKGNPIGTSNANPLMDTQVYEVSFLDGSTAAYAANVIAENTYAQVDDEGNQLKIIDELIDHCVDSTPGTQTS
jgi:hypothetical protein